MTGQKSGRFLQTIRNGNYIVRDHRVHGVRILPGVTYLDMIYRIGNEFLGHTNFELNNILFKEALAADNTFDQRVQVHFSFGNPHWQVKVLSQKVKGDCILEEEWHENMRCVLQPKEPHRDKKSRFSLRKFIRAALCEWPMEEVYGLAKSMNIVHGVFMKTLGRVYQRNRQELMVLHLSDLAEEFRPKFYAHPAFLDGATFAGSSIRLNEHTPGQFQPGIPYIPFSIKRFCLYNHLPSTIYVYSHFLEEKGGSETYRDLMTTDIRIYDKKGTVLAEFDGLTIKRIRDPRLIRKLIEKEIETTPPDEAPPLSFPGSDQPESRQSPPGLKKAGRTRETSLEQAIVMYMQEQVGKIINKNPTEVKTDAPFYELGLDSVNLLSLTEDLEEQCNHEFYPTLLFEYKTIQEIAGYLYENDRGSFEDFVDELEETGTGQEKSGTVIEAPPPRIYIPGERERANKVGETGAIAVIGLAGRYPGARDIRQFRDVIREGRDCITEIPPDHWQIKDHYSSDDCFDPLRPRTKSKWGGVISGVDQFDPAFFDISPREAEAMDPQLRILLEVCWHTLEDGGYTPGSFTGHKAGVYVGVMNSDYTWVAAEQYCRSGHYLSPGSYAHELANRVSYHLNFQGPSMTLSTACASSITAVHLARSALMQGECDVALAGGVNLSLHPSKYWMLNQLGIISPEGKERTFDKEARGYVPGEGAGMVLLKPLSQALRDGDQIYGVIRGSAVHHPGKGSGKYVPDVNALIQGIRDSLENSGVNPGDIRYIETHGTATQLGDSIEVQALSGALSRYTSRRGYCALGAKANIGHLESASGICSLTKVLLSIKYGEIPPCVNVQEVNPGIRIKETPFFIPGETRPWDQDPGERIAGINSFGVGGSQGFLVVQGVKAPIETGPGGEQPEIIVLSTKTESALQNYVKEVIDYLEEKKDPGYSLSNMAHTLQVGREAMPHRLAVLAKSETGLIRKLKQFVNGNETKGIYLNHITPQKEVEFKETFDGSEGEEFIQRLAAQKKWKKLAYLWTKGGAIPWESIHRENGACRISLPTYPFAKERFRIEGTETGNISSTTLYTAESAAYLHPPLHQDADLPTPRRFTSTPGGPGGESGAAESSRAAGTLIMRPCWTEQAVSREAEAAAPAYDRHLVIFCGYREFPREEIETLMTRTWPGVHRIFLPSKNKDIEKRFQTYAIMLFREIRGILEDKIKGRVLVQVVTQNKGEQQLFTGLSGLLKTARLENPKLIGQMIGLDPGENPEGIMEKLKENSWRPHDNQVRYQDGKRQTAGWSEIEAPREQADIRLPWKNRGVYLLTGGAGGLGLIFAGEIVRRVKEAAVILAGRSPLNLDRQARVKELQALGGRIEYKQVDITRKKAVDRLIRDIRADFGGLNGIIHGAGVIRDNFILKKTGEEFQGVMAPKVSGLVHLDQASKDLPLDFFIFFSSAAAVLGNIGQADYSTANAFMDAYAGYRGGLAALEQRRGRTLSIDWSLWKKGGMRVEEETQKMMSQSMGMTAMETPDAIRAFYRSFAADSHQVMVWKGKPAQLQQRLPLTSVTASQTPPYENTPGASAARDLHMEKVEHYFKKLASSVIKLPAHQIEADAPMEKYGIDSVMILQLTGKLEKIFGPLSKTLFFEYRDIRSLAGYFLQTRRDRLVELLGTGENAAAFIENSMGSPVKFGTVKSSPERGGPGRQVFPSTAVETRQEKPPGVLDIAIIGLSGRYPQAENTREFWKNLRDGKDCITEIPKERWDHSLYYDEDKNKPGKTYGKWGGFLDGVDRFDSLFFNISPREARLMDPQERLFLQCVYETLEDAGYTRENLGKCRDFGLPGNVGVYVGVMYEEYQLYGAQETILGRPIALTGNSSSLANRVSYFCDFHGPSMAVNTMCSSSLTAIHLACQSLKQEECRMAIAGGVNLSIHPNKYLLLGQGKFISGKGRCESFGQGGDGYVPGEGVGAVLLKPLSKAVADGDHIYGVIKATVINHGGKTNGYTVPNPNAQASAIGRAIKEAGISPETISYIEAHGTGTSLGDPIEITGLSKAFREYTQKNRYCAIGSAKSNIGHCESAAGIAGVTKVLLQLKHRQLAPSLHSKALNPNIDFHQTPFIVQQKLEKWQRPMVEIDGETREYPRTAGISSFGAGGANAHIIIREYIPDGPWEGQRGQAVDANREPAEPAIIVLSARKTEQLRDQARQLLDSLTNWNQPYNGAGLAHMAYTLQVGREAMEERLAVIVNSIEELKEKLNDFLEGREDVENLFRGQVKRNKETLSVFTMDEELQEAIEKWIRRRKYTKILTLWVKGLVFDWNKLYYTSQYKPRRISLPTYPFAKESYWVPGMDIKTVNPAVSPMHASLHPLLHQNTSDLYQQRFSSNFTGREFFLVQHEVKGQRVLPAVGHLEMARAAVELALGVLEPGRAGIQLKNVSWARPITVADQPVRVHIGIFPGDDGEIDYEIYSKPEAGNKEPIIHSRGQAIPEAAVPVPNLDIKALQAQCGQAAPGTTRIYETLPGRQGIEEVKVGPGKVLVRLSLPSSAPGAREQFVLEPALMDAILQVSAGLMTGPGHLKSARPLALRELSIFSNCTTTVWALVRYNNAAAGNGKETFDIDMCDHQGTVGMRVKGLACQTKPQQSISLRSSRPQTVNDAAFISTRAPDTAGKPMGISLRPLSDYQYAPHESTGQVWPSIPLSLPCISLSPLESYQQPGLVTPIPPAAPGETLEEELGTSLAKVLHLNPGDVDPGDEFIEMKLDPVKAVEWIQTINKRYGTAITISTLFNYAKIEKLAGYLEEELNRQKSPTPGNQTTPDPGQSSAKASLPTPALSSLESPEPPGYSTLQPNPVLEPTAPSPSSTAGESLRGELGAILAEALLMKQNDVDPDEKFIDMGMDSITGVEWISTINTRYGISVPATRIYDYPTLREFTGFLEKQLNKQGKVSTQRHVKSTASFSLDDLLEQVHHGTLDIKQADQLVHQFLSM